MKKNEAVLIAEIEKTTALISDLRVFQQQVEENELATLGKTRATAMMTAQILENFYTCLETLFFRISQYFENSLQQTKWHSDLLDKMILRIPGIRPAVISQTTYKNLLELMRFRHFKRYYFELDYDWKKLDYLTACLKDAARTLPAELDEFRSFLEEL